MGLLAGVYTFALPQFRVFTGLEVSSALNRMAVDIRSAYDVAVLTGKVHRLVFQFDNGEYWLEVTESADVYLSEEGVDRDLSKEEEEEQRLEYEERFRTYEEMAGEPIYDPDEEVDIAMLTPLIAAKDALQKPKWTMVKSLEWGKRNVGSLLVITAVHAEHHVKKQTVEEEEMLTHAYLYFFPDGYVERAIIHLTPTEADNDTDRAASTFTVRTNSFDGTATIVSGREELDLG